MGFLGPLDPRYSIGERLDLAAAQRVSVGAKCQGFQRRTGLRAADASSRRPIRVVWGALSTVSGSSCASWAIDKSASMKASSSSRLALSVGSIIMAPGTIRGKDVV